MCFRENEGCFMFFRHLSRLVLEFPASLKNPIEASLVNDPTSEPDSQRKTVFDFSGDHWQLMFERQALGTTSHRPKDVTLFDVASHSDSKSHPPKRSRDS
ncbi:hypothetical protein QCA50_006642 [Cerrena zonata]|uniref:Uncharacterized protein n=1 Tax=Cerrena zonata TaxID=2478898 RepID=A0AAW0G9D5_9APHY